MLSSVGYSVTAACGNPHPDSRQAISKTCLSLAHLPETLGRGDLGKEWGELYRVTTLPQSGRHRVLNWREALHARSAFVVERLIIWIKLPCLLPMFCSVQTVQRSRRCPRRGAIGYRISYQNMIWQLFLPPRLPPHIISGKPIYYIILYYIILYNIILYYIILYYIILYYIILWI